MIRAVKTGAAGLFWLFAFCVVAPIAMVLRDQRGEFTDPERAALETIFPDPGVE